MQGDESVTEYRMTILNMTASGERRRDCIKKETKFGRADRKKMEPGQRYQALAF